MINPVKSFLTHGPPLCEKTKTAARESDFFLT